MHWNSPAATVTYNSKFYLKYIYCVIATAQESKENFPFNHTGVV